MLILSPRIYPDRISPRLVMNEDLCEISISINGTLSGLKITNGGLPQSVIYVVRGKHESCIITSNVANKLK